MGDAFGPAHLRTTYEIPQAVTKVTSLTSHAPCIHISNLFPFACLLFARDGSTHGIMPTIPRMMKLITNMSRYILRDERLWM
jgi:hypothetical protein